jgi:hypothetical protein
MKRKQTFDEKNELVTVRPKKIIEQVRTFDGESDFIVPRKNTYIDKKNNTIVSLARDNSHSSVDTVGEYANAAAGSQSGCPQFGFSANAASVNNTTFQINITGVVGGQAPYSYTAVVTNSGSNKTYTGTIGTQGQTQAAGTSITDTGFATANGGVNGGTYGVIVTIQDANGCSSTPQDWSGGFNLVGLVPSTGGSNVVGGTNVVGNFGAPSGVKNTNNNTIKNVNVVNANVLTTVTAQVNPVTIQNFQASTAVLQPDTISVNVSYQDGKAPYTVDYTIIDQNGVVTVQQSNTAVNSLQDSLQPSPSGLSSGQYTVTVKVTGSDNSSDSKSEIVNVKGKTVVQSNLKLNNLNVTTTNLTTSGFDVNLSWSDGTSPYQVNAVVKSSGFAANHVMSESSKTHSWTQSLLVDNSGNPIYGNYDIGVEVTDSIGDVVQGFTNLVVPAPKPKPLSGILTETNKQNASFDVDYKFYNGVAPYTLTATLFHPVDASGNSQSFPINEVNLTNNGVFPVIITPMAGGAVLEGYYKMNNCVVTDANGQTANLNDLSVYLNGVKANIAPPPPPPPPTTTTTTPIIGGGGSVIIGGGGGVIPTVEPVVVAPKEKTGINWLLVIIALGVGYAIIRKKQ